MVEPVQLQPIVMYGADWCGDCLRAKAWLAAHDIEYTFVDLVENPDQVDTVLARNNGVQKIPLIVFPDNTHLVEPTNQDLEDKMASLEVTVVRNSEANRFELRRGDEVVSYATLRTKGRAVVIPHVETLAQHRGKGYAAQLMAGIVENVRAANETITPLCPFALGYLRDHPETHDLITDREHTP